MPLQLVDGDCSEVLFKILPTQFGTLLQEFVSVFIASRLKVVGDGFFLVKFMNNDQ